MKIDLANIDVLILACNLNATNYHIVNRERLLKLNEDFLLINAARGDLVNTAELLSVLGIRKSAFAVLDVFENEPADFNEFKNIPNLKLTSHIAGVYKNIDQATVEFEAQVIYDFINLDIKIFENKYKKMILNFRND